LLFKPVFYGALTALDLKSEEYNFDFNEFIETMVQQCKNKF